MAMHLEAVFRQVRRSGQTCNTRALAFEALAELATARLHDCSLITRAV